VPASVPSASVHSVVHSCCVLCSFVRVSCMRAWMFRLFMFFIFVFCILFLILFFIFHFAFVLLRAFVPASVPSASGLAVVHSCCARWCVCAVLAIVSY
jgi:hypothetical protein